LSRLVYLRTFGCLGAIPNYPNSFLDEHLDLKTMLEAKKQRAENGTLREAVIFVFADPINTLNDMRREPVRNPRTLQELRRQFRRLYWELISNPDCPLIVVAIEASTKLEETAARIVKVFNQLLEVGGENPVSVELYPSDTLRFIARHPF